MTNLLIGASGVATSEQKIQVAHSRIKVSSPATRYLAQLTASVIICSMINPSSMNGFQRIYSLWRRTRSTWLHPSDERSAKIDYLDTPIIATKGANEVMVRALEDWKTMKLGGFLCLSVKCRYEEPTR
jgi:hypothetical protein